MEDKESWVPKAEKEGQRVGACDMLGKGVDFSINDQAAMHLPAAPVKAVEWGGGLHKRPSRL